ncbi:MAG: hypothetical protein IZT55_02885 [Anaerolineae bacterium]|nr:hypothetical protein [Anaerolineae bacterium]
MQVLRPLAVLVILLTATTSATGATNSPETCQRMVLSLLDNFNVHQAKSKEQIIQFADKCMPESVLSRQSQDFKALRLNKSGRNTSTTQARI